LVSFILTKAHWTTPPDSESGNWLVLKQIIEASPEQIKVIYQLEDDNARQTKDKKCISFVSASHIETYSCFNET
jgi:carbonic anhydrase